MWRLDLLTNRLRTVGEAKALPFLLDSTVMLNVTVLREELLEAELQVSTMRCEELRHNLQVKRVQMASHVIDTCTLLLPLKYTVSAFTFE